jgi:hypothetical protein
MVSAGRGSVRARSTIEGVAAAAGSESCNAATLRRNRGIARTEFLRIRSARQMLPCHTIMTTEDLTKRLRLIHSLLKQDEVEFALALAAQLDEAITTLPADSARCVPTAVREELQSLLSGVASGTNQSN